jgi:hypothetical protein
MNPNPKYGSQNEKRSIILQPKFRIVNLTLLLIKLWSAITLLMRDDRYITSIISLVFTAHVRQGSTI